MADKGFNWFPGHMLKGKRIVSENIARVDALLELVDARIPLSSLNSDLYSAVKKGKPLPPRIILLNKCDLAEPSVTRKWIEVFKGRSIPTLEIDSRSGQVGVQRLDNILRDILDRKMSGPTRRGIMKATVHVMVVGIPNVGKSSLINRLSQRREGGRGSKARTGAMPGVTRGGQWLKAARGFEILDTPGILFPKISDEETGMKLAIAGTIAEKVLDSERIAGRLLRFYLDLKPEVLAERFGIDASVLRGPDLGLKLLAAAAQGTGRIGRGGVADISGAAQTVLADFRRGVLGRISLEDPGDFTREDLARVLDPVSPAP